MKNKDFYSFKNIIICTIIFLFVSGNLLAQETKVYQLFEDGTVSGAKPTKGKTLGAATSGDENLEDFYDLKNNLKPTIYMDNSKIDEVTGDMSPLKLKAEGANSIHLLKSTNSLYQSVELIIINLEQLSDLSVPLDVAMFTSFKSLKYIYLQCNFSCTVEQIRNYVKNAGPEITIYFMELNPS